MKSLFRKVRDGFKKTQDVVSTGIQQVVLQAPKIDEDLYDDLEAILLRADVGPTTTPHVLDRLKQEVRRRRIESAEQLRGVLGDIAAEILRQGRRDGDPLTPSTVGERRVVLLVGVNGVGKTTTLAKLAQRVKAAGETPLIVASDTFRAAASEQLQAWGKRLEVDVVTSQSGADPSAVAFDGIQSAAKRNASVILVDTAGRLQTKHNLMEELRKIHRVCGKAQAGAPHETLLVLDATIGQNAISQARLFTDAVPITGLVLAKLDGTSKGGVVLAIAHELGIPVRYVGVGEQADDLVDFDPDLFARGLMGDLPEEPETP
ncbi:MAG: signal recognition particle-docking protein FtsY [Candidatus Eisenbacteria bacterium]